MKALIFAAGKGTRLQPFTNHHPKALALVNNVPLLERNIKYLQSFGINDFVINIHHFGAQIVDFLADKNNFGAQIHISDEKEELLETGGGLVFARGYFLEDEDFVIMNADILTNLDISDLIEEHKANDSLVTLAVSDRNSTRKLLFDEALSLKGWHNLTTKEKKLADVAMSQLTAYAFSGIHCVNAKIFNKIKRTGKFSIMDEYLDMMKTETIKAYIHQANLIDVGKPESIAEAEKLFI